MASSCRQGVALLTRRAEKQSDGIHRKSSGKKESIVEKSGVV